MEFCNVLVIGSDNCSKAEVEVLFWKGKHDAFLVQSKGMY